MIDVAPGNTAFTVINTELIYTINGNAQDVYDMPVETTKALMTLPCRSVVDDKGLVRRRSCTLTVYVTPSR